MTFDVLLFNGQNPFDAGEEAEVIRLNDVTEDEAKLLNDIVSRNPEVGMFLYISDVE